MQSPAHPVVLYRATRGSESAVLELGRHPLGPDVIWRVDGRHVFSSVCRNPAELEERVAALRADIAALGWTFDDDDTTRH